MDYNQHIQYESGDFVVGKSAIMIKGTSPATFAIKAPAAPTVTANADWVTASVQQSQGAGIYNCTVTCADNSAYDARTATISVKAGSFSKDVTVTQSGTDAVVVVSAPNEPLDANGGTFSIVYGSTGEVTISAPSWIKKVESRAYDESTLTFEYSANVTGETRTGDIVISLDALPDVQKTITLSQDFVVKDVLSGKSAKEIASAMYVGVNLGNTMEALDTGSGTYGETIWGAAIVNEEYIAAIKAAGFNTVRIPCAWQYSMDVNYNIDSKWLDRVQEVVDYCINAGMYVILNEHWDGGWLENDIPNGFSQTVADKHKKLWEQVAIRFADYDQHLLLACCNEPNANDAAGCDVLRRYEQIFLDAVRSAGGKNIDRVLIVQGPNTNIDQTVSRFTQLPTDSSADRLMVEIHYYDPWLFCGLDKDESWGKMAYFWGEGNLQAGSDRNTNHTVKDMQTQFGKMKKAFVDKGIPVLMGEYGAIMRHSELKGDELKAHNKSRADWDRAATREAKNYGLVPVFWDTPNFFFNRTNGKIVLQDDLDAVMVGASEGQYPY